MRFEGEFGGRVEAVGNHVIRLAAFHGRRSASRWGPWLSNAVACKGSRFRCPPPPRILALTRNLTRNLNLDLHLTLNAFEAKPAWFVRAS